MLTGSYLQGRHWALLAGLPYPRAPAGLHQLNAARPLAPPWSCPCQHPLAASQQDTHIHPSGLSPNQPMQVNNTALDTRGDVEKPLVIPCSPSGPFVGLAFKLEEGR